MATKMSTPPPTPTPIAIQSVFESMLDCVTLGSAGGRGARRPAELDEETEEKLSPLLDEVIAPGAVEEKDDEAKAEEDGDEEEATGELEASEPVEVTGAAEDELRLELIAALDDDRPVEEEDLEEEIEEDERPVELDCEGVPDPDAVEDSVGDGG